MLSAVKPTTESAEKIKISALFVLSAVKPTTESTKNNLHTKKQKNKKKLIPNQTQLNLCFMTISIIFA